MQDFGRQIGRRGGRKQHLNFRDDLCVMRVEVFFVFSPCSCTSLLSIDLRCCYLQMLHVNVHHTWKCLYTQNYCSTLHSDGLSPLILLRDACLQHSLELFAHEYILGRPVLCNRTVTNHGVTEIIWGLTRVSASFSCSVMLYKMTNIVCFN